MPEDEVIDSAVVEHEEPVVETAETVEPKSLRETLTEAVAEVKEKSSARDDKGKFSKKLELSEDKAEIGKKAVSDKTTEVKEIPAPAAWKSETKQKWNTIPPDIQQEILRREEEVHKGFTRLDEERQLGKQIKETLTPYMATIRAEGGTPITAVAELLNTAHVLRTGDPMTKARAVQQVINQFGIDMRLVAPQQGQPQNSEFTALQQKLAQIEHERQQEKQLQAQQQSAKVQSEIEAFAADPVNEFFPQVKAVMASMLRDGHSTDLKEAYEAAVLANPTTRSLYLQRQATGTRRTEDVGAKKRAAVSVTGSSSKSNANADNPNRTLREELAYNMRKALLD